ncbi:hypothetical protein [Oscillibacter sp.]|uniref:hypothetical protein n=1 Tax=Oscillibacter sp. TaxID=1945593 RepID=UPI002D804B7D|nr:hypothetical protein [Oscillibacter sp.]
MPEYLTHNYSKFQEFRVPKFFVSGARVFAASAKDGKNLFPGLLDIRVAAGQKVR